MNAQADKTSWTVPMQTSAGLFTATFGTHGLISLDFPGGNKRGSEKQALPPEVVKWAATTAKALEAALAGRKPGALPQIDCSNGSAFQQRVWAALRAIAPGSTRTYGEIAAEIGSPGAARAVGSACGANPIPVLVPCHRVLATGGGLGGFSGGLEWKKRLLVAEGVELL